MKIENRGSGDYPYGFVYTDDGRGRVSFSRVENDIGQAEEVIEAWTVLSTGWRRVTSQEYMEARSQLAHEFGRVVKDR